MSQSTALIGTLKSQLKAHGKTYSDVAKHLKLSHASVKRLFSEETISLTRLESICELIDISITDLVLSMDAINHQIDCLTLQQEQEIADDLLLLLVAVCVINGFSYQDLLTQYTLNEYECIQKLAKLDKLKIIDLLPGNKFKLKISKNFTWLPDGPIQRFFLKYVQEEFFNSRFSQTTEKLIVINGLLSLPSNAELQKKMQKLSNEFVECKQKDSSITMDQKHGSTMVLALRQWQSNLFHDISKTP